MIRNPLSRKTADIGPHFDNNIVKKYRNSCSICDLIKKCYNFDINVEVITMTYAEAIKELRKKLILSQTEFAELLGVSFQSINRWEKGKHEPTIKVKRKLATYFIKHGIEVN